MDNVLLSWVVGWTSIVKISETAEITSDDRNLGLDDMAGSYHRVTRKTSDRF